MNTFKKLISLLLVVVTLTCFLSTGVAVNAATPAAETKKVVAGGQVTILFEEDACYGVSGDISYSNRDLFSSVTPVNSPYGQVREKRFILSSADKDTMSVKLTVTVSETAAVGSTCVITFTYLRANSNTDLTDVTEGTKSVTVEVVKAEPTTTPTTSTTKPGDPTTTTQPGTPTTTVKPAGPTTTVVPVITTTEKGTTTTTVALNLDLTELNKQIKMAQSLKKALYTTPSWKKMQTALKAAIAARSATTQAAVDKAANDLKNAILALVLVDDTALEELIASVTDFIDNEELTKLAADLFAALDEAKAALKSGNQDRINEAYTALSDAFEAYKAKLEELSKGQIIEVEKPVEVEPTDPFCNIWLHKLWLILFIVSAVLNVAFIVLAIVYFTRRKKFADTTPLVDYDINDD